jgi:hypothetical protein
MVDYTWAFPALERDIGNDDAVTTVHWRLLASEGGLTTEAYGSAGLPAPGDDFVPYAELTPDVVILWLEDLIDADAIKANLAERLAEMAAPKSTTAAPPWA